MNFLEVFAAEKTIKGNKNGNLLLLLASLA